jgi:hypothetical protein
MLEIQVSFSSDHTEKSLGGGTGPKTPERGKPSCPNVLAEPGLPATSAKAPGR